ncbi:MAG: Rne/Rng family ribonuclease [Bacteroidetes bacterium]|nr:Rne/Rng family ribonuclease [Bacteroidota bacterium]
MASELFIDCTAEEVRIALLENKRLVELNTEKSGREFQVGDIYLGRIRKLIPSLNAAFVDIGYSRDAFLHYLDLGPQFRSLDAFVKQSLSGRQTKQNLENFSLLPDINKHGKITEIFSTGQSVLVQIAKEPIANKGPRLTSLISLAGRYLVMIPFHDKVSLSQKIKIQQERDRLKNLTESIRPKNFGFIIRTVAENKTASELVPDLNDLVKKWEQCYLSLVGATPPVKILGEENRTTVILRDLVNAEFSNIYINDRLLCDETRQYLRTIAPEKEKIVKLFQNKSRIFDHFGIDRQIKSLFGKYITMESGAYLIIEHTEAMHVIDVNSGTRTASNPDPEANAYATNIEAAKEIARQLRLRDMGGIIVVDFIDMRSDEYRRKVYETLINEMKTDRAQHKILPPSRFNLIEITRERVRPVINIQTTEKCPACDGTGEIRSSVLILDQIENNIRYILREQNEPSITLEVHPFMHAYLTKGLFSIRIKWILKYKKKIKILPDSSLHLVEFRFRNHIGNEIKI